MWRYLGLMVLITRGAALVSTFPGIEFRDNAGQKYLTEENGVAITTTRVQENKIFEGQQFIDFRSPIS